MKIIHVILNLGYGGAENMLVKLVNQDKDNSILIITLADYSPLKARIVNKNVSHAIGFPKGASKIFSFIRLISLIRKFKPDIIQSWMYHSELIGLLLTPFCPKARLFWNIRCSTSEWLKLRFRNKVILRVLIGGSGVVSGIIVNSHVELEESILLGYPAKKLIYIPNGFEPVQINDKPSIRQKLLTNFNLDRKSIIIGIVTKNSILKDIDTLLKAFQLTNKQVPDTHLILVGSGFDDVFCDKLRNMGLQDVVHIYGTTNNIFEVIPGFDIAALSSKTESFPNVIAEYMLSTVPVVSTNVSDIPEIIGEYGIAVPPGDPEAFSNALISVINMPVKDRIILGKKARERIIENYPISKIYDSYLDLYNKKILI